MRTCGKNGVRGIAERRALVCATEREREREDTQRERECEQTQTTTMSPNSRSM